MNLLVETLCELPREEPRAHLGECYAFSYDCTLQSLIPFPEMEPQVFYYDSLEETQYLNTL